MAKKSTKKANHSKDVVDECVKKLCDNKFPVASQMDYEETDDDDTDDAEYEINIKPKTQKQSAPEPVPVIKETPEPVPVIKETPEIIEEPAKPKRTKKITKTTKRVTKPKVKKEDGPDYKTLFETLSRQQEQIDLLKEKSELDKQKSRFNSHYSKIQSMSGGKDTKIIF